MYIDTFILFGVLSGLALRAPADKAMVTGTGESLLLYLLQSTLNSRHMIHLAI